MSALFTQCPGDTVQTGTGKVDPARKFKCTTAARVDVFFSRFSGFSLKIILVDYAHALSLSLIQHSMRLSPLSCLMVIATEKSLNIEKTTYSVLSVLLLIYD